MKKAWILMSVLPLAMVLVAGCGSKADSSKPIEEVKAEAEKMSVGDLESTAKAYVKEIKSQTEELGKVKDKLKDLSPKDLLSEKAKTIKDEISGVSKEISELTKRYNIYVDKLKAQGGDLSKVQI